MAPFKPVPQLVAPCFSWTCRMESGLGKMKKRQWIVARPSPALGVLFWAVFDHAWIQIDVIVYNSQMYFCCCVWVCPCIEVGLLWFHNTIIIVSVSLSFLSNLLWLDNKFWLSWGFVCWFVGWGSRNPLRTWMWACCSLLKFHIYHKISTVGSLWYDLASMIEYGFAQGQFQLGRCRSNGPRAGHCMFHSGLGHSALAQAKATYSTPRKRFVLAFGQAFVRVGALRGKLAENWRKSVRNK